MFLKREREGKKMELVFSSFKTIKLKLFGFLGKREKLVKHVIKPRYDVGKGNIKKKYIFYHNLQK